MAKCKDCQRFYNLTVNAVKIRKHGRQPSLSISREAFLEWARSGARSCHFCGVSEEDLPKLQLKSSIGLLVEALGIDRLDNEGDYTISNIAFCCYACNKAKGNVFTTPEMERIGAAIAEVWRGRL